MAAVSGWLSHTWAIIRAVFGVIGAAAVIVGGILIGLRISNNRGGDKGGSGSAEQVKRDNSEAVKGLDDALDILRRARGRASS